MGYKVASIQLLLSLALIGCATHYNPPDATKVIETTKLVKRDLTDAVSNQKEIRKAILEAQQSTNKVADLSSSGLERVDQIIHLAPEFLKPQLLLLQNDITESKAENQNAIDALSRATERQDKQDEILTRGQTHELELETHQQDYQDEAAKLAKIATSQSEKLAWYRLHWWGSWAVFAAGVIVCIIFFALKAGGKFGL